MHAVGDSNRHPARKACQLTGAGVWHDRDGQLRGTTRVTLVNGIATFSNLSIDKTGVDYTLKASVLAGLTDATSRAFSVLAVP